MLPSRGLSRSHPASALRVARSARTQPIRPLQVPLRHFSQAQSRSILPNRSLAISSTPISAIGTRTVLAAATSSVFAQRSGASRNLSLWPFSSKQKSPVGARSAPSGPSPKPVESAAPPEASAQDAPAIAQEAPVSNATEHVDLSSVPAQSSSFSDLELPSILDMPEQIGYLKNLGLEFGWGPTACCQWVAEHLHIYMGMPWWAVLTAMAFAWRAAFFVPTLESSKHQMLLQKLTKDPAYLQAKAQHDEAVYKTRDRVAQREAQEKLLKIKRESGASTLKSLAALWSFPFTWGMFRLVRGMAAIPVPSMETGGMLWFADLSQHDPYYILPFTSVAITVLMFKQNQAANLAPQTEMAQFVQKGMIYGLPPVMFLATAWLPAGLQWFFLVFGVASVAQSTATLNPAIRRWANMPPLPGRGGGLAPAANVPSVTWQAPTAPPSGGIMDSVLNSAETRKKEQWRKAQEYEARRAAEDKERAYRQMDEIRRRRAEKRRL